MMTYKGYTGLFAYDQEADIFHGDVIGIVDVVTFQGRSIDALKKALADSVEDYLDMCKELGKDPNKPFSGRFSLRLEPELHSQVARAAATQHASMNAWITSALKRSLSENQDLGVA